MENNARGQYAAINGLEMYYQIHGSGTPLVLLHGAFGSAEGWGTILPALVKTHQVILVEQQGHGHTADRDTPLRVEQMADDTAALLKHLGIAQADIFGYSMGGTVGFGLAIRHPELVRTLTTLGAHAAPLKNAFEPASYQQFLSIPADFAPPSIKEPYDRVAPDPSRWPLLVSKLKSMGIDFTGFSPQELSAITAPTLILQGDRDGVRPEQAVAMFRGIPNARLAIFPGGDHFLLWSRPEAILSALVPFLNAPLSELKKQENE